MRKLDKIVADKTLGFDSPDLYRIDTLLRIKNFEAESRERAKVIEEMESKLLDGDRRSEEEDDECE